MAGRRGDEELAAGDGPLGIKPAGFVLQQRAGHAGGEVGGELAAVFGLAPAGPLLQRAQQAGSFQRGQRGVETAVQFEATRLGQRRDVGLQATRLGFGDGHQAAAAGAAAGAAADALAGGFHHLLRLRHHGVGDGARQRQQVGLLGGPGGHRGLQAEAEAFALQRELSAGQGRGRRAVHALHSARARGRFQAGSQAVSQTAEGPRVRACDDQRRLQVQRVEWAISRSGVVCPCSRCTASASAPAGSATSRLAPGVTR